MRSFYDPSVGCVTGQPIFKCDEGLTSIGVSKQDKYELYLRSKLGEINSLFGAQDCIYAVPRRMFRPVRKDLDSGFVGPLKILEIGYRTVYEPDAIAYVNRPAPSAREEFIRRARIVLRGMRGLIHMRQLMNPFRYGFLSIALISSRLVRWLTPVFLVVLLFTNAFLLDVLFYVVTFWGQVVFYLIAFSVYILERNGCRVGSIFSIPFYFCVLAASAGVGLVRLLAGESGQVWETRRIRKD